LRYAFTWLSCLTVALAAAAPASATSFVVNQTMGATGTVTGTIDTDGTIGALASGNFSAWNLLVTGNGISMTLTNFNSGLYISGTGPTATATDISFDFSNAVASYLLFQAGGFGSGNTYWCNASASGACAQGATATPESYLSASFQTEARSGVQVIASSSGTTTAAVPEPSTWAMLIAGFGVTAMAMRRRRPTMNLAYA
jgi:hypothetical protein